MKKTIVLLVVALVCIFGAFLVVRKVVRDHQKREMIAAQREMIAAQKREMIAAMNPEKRTPEAVARSVLEYRLKLNPNSTKSVSDAYVKRVSADAVCLLDKMSRSDSSFHQNLYNYINVEARKKAIENIDQLQREGLVDWLDTTAEQLLQEPLDCVKDVDGACMKQMDDGRECLLLKPLAKALTQANRRMAEAGKGQLMPTRCYQSNLAGAAAFVAITGKGCDLSAERPGISLPSKSSHSMASAFDLANPKEAKRFVMDAGITCGSIFYDENHCYLDGSWTSRQYLQFNKNKQIIPGLISPLVKGAAESD